MGAMLRKASSQPSPPHTSSSVPIPNLVAAARPELAARLQPHYADVGTWPTQAQLPIVYAQEYNITFGGIEKLHPMDSAKYGKVVAGLQRRGLCTAQQLVRPKPASVEILAEVHDTAYLEQLHTSSAKVAQVTELAPLAVMPMALVERFLLRPMRHHVGGTILAAALALERGWAINLGGGMHHAHASDGSGWCPYDDITLAVRRIRRASGGEVRRVLVVDLDAHQGNGVERDKLLAEDADLVILDMFNSSVFPMDHRAKAAIDVQVPLAPGTGDAKYLAALDAALREVEGKLRAPPHLLVYNAGTDVLQGDPLGRLGVSLQGVVERDARVLTWAAERRVPVVMLLSGGYTKASATAIEASVANIMAAAGTAPA